jgi:hypothetical protein
MRNSKQQGMQLEKYVVPNGVQINKQIHKFFENFAKFKYMLMTLT